MGGDQAAEYYNAKGVTLRRMGRIQEALDASNKALALNSRDPDILKNHGAALMAAGRWNDAIAAYEEALDLSPGDATAHVQAGIAFAALGYPELALAQFGDAEQCEPQGAGQARTWSGAVLWHLGDVVGARRRFEFVQGQVTGCSPFRSAELEAIALCGLGQPYEAEKHLHAAARLRTTADAIDPSTMYDLLAAPPLPGIDRLRSIVTATP
jgi:tetratricopeptide (TPR) repeat protein